MGTVICIFTSHEYKVFFSKEKFWFVEFMCLFIIVVYSKTDKLLQKSSKNFNIVKLSYLAE
jgi:hypothetical protein